MEQNNTEKLKQIIFNLLQKMDFDVSIFERQEEGRIVFNVKTRDAQLLIGRQGATLESLQHIIRVLYRKEMGDDRFPFALDIDDYKDKRVIYLKELARKAAHYVKDNRRAVSLTPMPAYERRVVHNYLSLYSDISSGSIGEEPNRKIIIRPKGPEKAKEKEDNVFDFIENS